MCQHRQDERLNIVGQHKPPTAQQRQCRIVQHAAQYGGFGDFRPRFGRATAEVKHV